MPKSLSRLDKLLGTDISSVIRSVADADSIVEESLRDNSELFRSWMSSHGFNDEASVHEHFKALLYSAEAELGRHHDWGDLSRKEDLERAVRFLAGKRPPMRAGMYLRDDSAILILSKLPPVNLMRAMNARVLEDLLGAFTLLDIIALSRHTESDEWQDAYLSELAKLGLKHFETRPVRFLVVDRRLLSRASAGAGRALKPWSASHNKESGTITLYTYDAADKIATPRLLLTMLLFHYYFETLRAAHLAREWGERHNDRSGERFAQMILTTRRSLSFDSPNVHSEALHWKDAVTYVGKLFPKLSFGEYSPYISCGEFLSEKAAEPLSLNIVDHLWNINLDARSEYFEQQQPFFTYHFREALWSKVLQSIGRISESEMRKTVFAQLDLDDDAFTRQMLIGIGAEGFLPEGEDA